MGRSASLIAANRQPEIFARHKQQACNNGYQIAHPSVYIFVFERRKDRLCAWPLAILRQYTARGVERLYAQRIIVASLGEPRRLDPGVDLLFMVNPYQINV